MSPRKTSGWGKPAKRQFQFKDRSGRLHGGGAVVSEDDSKKEEFSSRPGKLKKPSQFKSPVKPNPNALPIIKSRPGSGVTRPVAPGKKKKGRPAPGGGSPKFGGESKKFDSKKKDFHKKEERRPGKAPAYGMRTLKATVDKNRKGFGFLIFENRKIEDAFIPPREAENLFHGDRVEAMIDARGNLYTLKVLEHRFREVVGRYKVHPVGNQRGGWVVYERKRAREEIFIPEINMPVNDNDWIQAKLTFHEKGPHPVTAVITQVFGPELPPSADIGMVAAEYNLTEEHSAEAEREARSFQLPTSFSDRTDFRQTPFITIDGETARDFDDAVFVETASNGNYVLWVAIADVSHYVTSGTALDAEAKSRGTSVYFPERAFHMLPRALSENLCSLKPDEPRLTLVAKMIFDQAGERVSTELFEGVIQSKRRATYNQIQAEFLEHGKDPKWEFKNHFTLYTILRKMRSERGSIDFDLPEAELVVKPTGEVVSLKQRDRIDAHRLIEEFMIAANEAVTVWMLERHWPFIYRTHDEPSQQSLMKFTTLAKNVGVNLRLDGEIPPKVLADIVRTLEGHPAQALLNSALLRSMKTAVYSSTHGGHYGLASEAYTHFTSPIRRYPDLVVHRLLRKALRIEQKKEPALKGGEIEALEKELAETTEHCSYRERIATDAERDSIKLKQVRLMLEHIGDEYEAKIVGMADVGLFVQILNPYVEGIIVKDSMEDDAYEFNEDRMVFYGRRKRRTFKMGDILKVRVLRSDIDRRQIEFGLLS